jgi:hypothetical protein
MVNKTYCDRCNGECAPNDKCYLTWNYNKGDLCRSCLFELKLWLGK